MNTTSMNITSMNITSYQNFINEPTSALYESHDAPVLIGSGDNVTHVVMTMDEYAQLQEMTTTNNYKK